MKNTGVIFLFLVVAALLYAAYYFVIKNKSTSTDDGITIQSEPKPVHVETNIGEGDITPSVSGSILVNSSEISTAQSPSTYFNSLTDKNVSSHNVLSFQAAHTPLIHFTSSFTGTCSQYVWYQRSMYVFVSSKSDNNGNKTCYYKFDKSIFPSQIKVKASVVSDNCSVFKYYISGIEYRFIDQKTESIGLGMYNKFCVYQKQ